MRIRDIVATVAMSPFAAVLFVGLIGVICWRLPRRSNKGADLSLVVPVTDLYRVGHCEY